MDERLQRPVTCTAFREHLFRYQSDELPEQDRAALQDHLDRCGDCARRLELENRLLAAVREGLPREPAPAGLEGRLRRALADAGPAPRAWWKGPVFATLAAVFLVAAFLAPVLLNRDGAGEPGVFTGTVVDLECDRKGYPVELQKRCPDRNHVNALRLDDGTYLHFNLFQTDYRSWITGMDLRGSRITIHGTLHPSIRTLDITGVEQLSGRL